MANENELKFVLRDYAELEAALSKFDWHDIHQGYLNPNARVRRIILPDGRMQHFFTYKQRLPNGHNLEFEPEISMADYDEAWPFTTERVRKRRVTLYGDPAGDAEMVKWDVDFYRWSQPFFVLAEVEMPAAMLQPDAILPVLEPYIVYGVPRDDGRFAARRLSDETHVQAMARELELL